MDSGSGSGSGSGSIPSPNLTTPDWWLFIDKVR